MTDPTQLPLIHADLELARRLERAEARSNAAFVEARARLFPDLGAGWIDVAGAYAMFDGPASPCTQTFGLGLFDPVTDAELERLEAFFLERGAPVFHEVSPLADLSLLPLLAARGYHPIELTSVLFRPLHRAPAAFSLDRAPAAASADRVRIHLIAHDEGERWAQTSARGWSEQLELGEFMLELGRVNVHRDDALSFIAELDGQPIATGMMSIHEGVAMLAGASTVPEGRRQGAQLALLEARLRYAADHGCDIAMMGALPGSGSQRNAERHGFRVAYTRIKWRKG